LKLGDSLCCLRVAKPETHDFSLLLKPLSIKPTVFERVEIVEFYREWYDESMVPTREEEIEVTIL
jgi:hypothetical protein